MWRSKLVQYFLLEIPMKIYHWVSKAQYRFNVHSCKGSFVISPWYQHQCDLLTVFRAFLPGNLSHSHLQSLFLLLADRTVLIGIIQFVSALMIPPTVHSFHGLRWSPQVNIPEYPHVHFKHLPNLKGFLFFQLDINMSYTTLLNMHALHAVLKFTVISIELCPIQASH